MKTIWKFGLIPNENGVTLAMPAGAQVLCVQAQRETPCLWAVVDSDAYMVSRVFRTFGTGHPVPPGLVYIGTYQLHGGALVLHVFEEPAGAGMQPHLAGVTGIRTLPPA